MPCLDLRVDQFGNRRQIPGTLTPFHERRRLIEQLQYLSGSMVDAVIIVWRYNPGDQINDIGRIVEFLPKWRDICYDAH